MKWALVAVLCLFGVDTVRADEPAYVIAPTYADSKEAPRVLPKIAKGAPNIVWILLDDVGFGASGTFGGLIATPTFDKLAAGGLRYTNFHTTGVCATTRAALLTGRNHHAVGMGIFPHPWQSAGFPGYSGRMEPKDGTVAAYLRDAGYSTYALGKWHLTPDEETTDLGPFDRWPSGMGFDHFLGFHWAGTDQYKPDLVEDNNHVTPDGRHLNALLVDKAIFYLDRQQRLNKDKPFFLYLATGATHAPLQVEPTWVAKYKGKFDAGWDVARAQILARQKKLGVVPADAHLPPRDPHVPAWDSLMPEQKKVYARFMEVYAGFMEYTDSEIGRLLDHIQKSGLTENTAIFVMIGDNGAAKEAGPNGTLMRSIKTDIDLEAQLAHLHIHMDLIGAKESYSNYPSGWAQAMNTPFRHWKGDANSEGGTRNPMIVYWPGRVAKGTRTQYSFVNDLLPTTLEIAGVAQPTSLRGIAQTPVQGVSLVESMKDARTPTRHTQQHYFLLGSAAMVKDGWKASFMYTPDLLDQFGKKDTPPAVAIDSPNAKWELYDLNTDFNERNNVAAKNPAKLKELQDLFKQEMTANNGYPLINFGDVSARMKAFMDARDKAEASEGHKH